jgi:hypothetical protein
MKPWQASLDKAPSKSKGGKEEEEEEEQQQQQQREKKTQPSLSKQAWSLRQNPKWIIKGLEKQQIICSRSPHHSLYAWNQ